MMRTRRWSCPCRDTCLAQVKGLSSVQGGALPSSPHPAGCRRLLLPPRAFLPTLPPTSVTPPAPSARRGPPLAPPAGGSALRLSSWGFRLARARLQVDCKRPLSAGPPDRRSEMALSSVEGAGLDPGTLTSVRDPWPVPSSHRGRERVDRKSVTEAQEQTRQKRPS